MYIARNRHTFYNQVYKSDVVEVEMFKAIVFDLGGTLMEYTGMPLNWNDYYICGFENLNRVYF